jgi:hypothetical protein
MTEEEKLSLLERLAKGARIGNLVIDNHGTMTLTASVGSEEAKEQGQQQEAALSTLRGCVDSVRQFFWGDSAMAVVFCVCRDCFGYANNMSRFEREFNCTEGLLSNTFRNNPYMRLPVDKWMQNGAKERTLKLVEAYQHAVEEQLQR